MDPKKPPEQNKNPIIHFIMISMILTLIFNSLLGFFGNSYNEITYDEFITKLEAGVLESVTIQSDRLVIKEKPRSDLDLQSSENEEDSSQNGVSIPLSSTNTSNPFYKFFKEEDIVSTGIVYYTARIGDTDLVRKLDENGVEYGGIIIDTNPIMEFFVTWILPILILYGMFALIGGLLAKKMGGRGGLMNVGKSNAKVYIEKKTGVTFDDVAGQEEAKESLLEIVDFLHHPDKYLKIGAKQPKGALLVGSPGTGKTLLAKAVAGEADVAFFSISGSDFVEMFVGVGASRVRDLFKQAGNTAPCIVFIDEIDAIGKSRDSAIGGGGNDEREQTLNQLLSEMDGFDSSKGVVILGATNRPEVLDKALLRPGRFDRRIIVDKPDLKGREEILNVHADKVKLGDGVDIHQIAQTTSGAAGADLANMVNEAALRAVRLGRDLVLQEDLLEAVEIIIAGKEKKDRILTKKEKEIVAYHEVGHALTSALLKNTQPVHKITIVPRTMGALGYVLQVPEEEKFLMTKDEILAEITTFLGGRCAEQLIFDVATTGAANDIERATELARSMVAQYGMSEKFGMIGIEKTQSKYLDGRNVSTCSEQTNAEVDKEVMRILKEAYDSSYEILENNQEALHKIAKYLLEKESISGTEFLDILNEFLDEKIVPYKSKEEKKAEADKDDDVDNTSQIDISISDSSENQDVDNSQGDDNSENQDVDNSQGDDNSENQGVNNSQSDDNSENQDVQENPDDEKTITLEEKLKNNS